MTKTCLITLIAALLFSTKVSAEYSVPGGDLRATQQDNMGLLFVRVVNGLGGEPLMGARVEVHERIIDTLPSGELSLRGVDEAVLLQSETTDYLGEVFFAVPSLDSLSLFKVVVTAPGFWECTDYMVAVRPSEVVELTFELMPILEWLPSETIEESLQILRQKHDRAKVKLYEENPQFHQQPEPVSTDDLLPSMENLSLQSTYAVPEQVYVCNLQGYTGYINLDEYIKGVVSAEMGDTFPYNALKTQAIAARTYALRRFNDTGCANGGQAYTSLIGPKSGNATINTSRIVLLYGGREIYAYYSARCHGDYTLNSEDGVWHRDYVCDVGGNYEPYARSRPCSGHPNCSSYPGESPCCYVFTGGRLVYIYGHGVGMCQRGVEQFAKRDCRNWDWILSRFYTDIQIANAWSFQVGDRVKATHDGLSSRFSPCGDFIRAINAGETGRIIGGPTLCSFSGDCWPWWQIAWDGGYSGWSVEAYLERIGGDNPPVVNDFNVTPDSVTLGNSFAISYTVSDDIGLQQVELWRATDVNGDGEPDWPDYPEGYIDIHYLSGETSYSGTFYDTPSSADTYWYGVHVVDTSGQWSAGPDPPVQVTVTSDGTTPPICVIELLEKDRIDPIDQITVDEWFDIYVGDSTDDIGISEVRFSSDESQDGIPQGSWTEWYDWEVSTGPYGWDSMNKRMAWAFATSGRKEVWVELKDSEGQTSRCCANIRVPCVCTSWQDQGCGQGPCFETQMYQTRICDSPGCAVEERCINHMSCEPGWKSPTATGRCESEWFNPENAYSSDNQYAVADSWYSDQDWYNFGFDIPAGSIIEGIEIGIEGTGDGDDYVGKVKCSLNWGCHRLDAETDYLQFPATEDATHIVGGPSDLWGHLWTPENFEDDADISFGVRLMTGADWHTARIDSIQARVYYRVCPDVFYDWYGLSCLVDSWLQQCGVGNDYCNCCDMNNDGIIDFVDFAIFASFWLE